MHGRPLVSSWFRRTSWYLSGVSITDLPQVQALSIREKLALVDELWKSVPHDLDRLAVSDEEKDLLDARWSEFLADPAKALSIEQFQDRISQSRR